MNTNDNDLKTLEGIDTLKIELRPLTSLKSAKRNARTHSKKQIGQIASSISQFGFNVPLLVDPDGVIVAGQGRLEAARLLALADVPVSRSAIFPVPSFAPSRLRTTRLPASRAGTTRS